MPLRTARRWTTPSLGSYCLSPLCNVHYTLHSWILQAVFISLFIWTTLSSVCSLYPNVPTDTGVDQTQAFFLHPIKISVGLKVHLLNTPNLNYILKPWFIESTICQGFPVPFPIVTQQVLLWHQGPLEAVLAVVMWFSHSNINEDTRWNGWHSFT